MPQPMVPTRSAREFERVSRSLQLTVGAVLAGVGLALINMVLYTSNSFAQAAPPSVPDLPLGSLKTVSVKEPPNLGDFVADKQTAIALGKAFFWDMQMGSDGLTACATCHYQAGADVRSKNTLNPGMAGGDTRFQLGGPNYQLTGGDFPFHRFTEPWNNQSPVASDNNDVVGATGVFGSVFKLPGAPGALTRGQDACTQISGDAPFAVGSINTRRVTGRNAPSAINAAYNFRNFWDGRANNNFNGFNPFGDRDPNLSNPNVKSGIWVSAANNTLTQVKISIPYSSLASQAVGPPGSPFEMSCDGRIFPNMGRKMLTVVPLGQQLVDASDGVLGGLASSRLKPGGKGLSTTYVAMIQKAFKPQYWNSKSIITIGDSSPVTLSMLMSDIFKLAAPGKVTLPLKAADQKRIMIPTNQYSQIEANFSLFWGLAIQLYEDTLLANDSPVDKFFDGNASALTEDQVQGMAIFQGQGRCINCHGGAETTNASIRKVSSERLERMITGNGEVGVYDDGFYDIGARAATEDVGVAGVDPWGNPLSEVGRCQQLMKSGKTCDPAVQNLTARPLEGLSGTQLGPNDRIVVNGSFKVPGLRNVELTGPYFHNGGQATLRQVVDFYDRGGDFARQNSADLDTDVSRIGLTDDQKRQLVAFLVGLTDERVRWEKAPFDHPELFIPDGHPGSTSSITNDALHPGQATDTMTRLPAVGKGGRTTGPLNPFLGLDPQSGGIQAPAPPPPPPPPVLPAPATVLPTGLALASGTLISGGGLTAPAGMLQMGSHTWIADEVAGLCRLDPQPNGTLVISAPTCSTAAISPGQPAFDPSTGFVYVPDRSSKSPGVWRLVFDPAAQTVGQPTLMLDGQGLAAIRTTAAAIGSDHNLYIGSAKTGDIKRINDPAGASPTLQTIGRTSDGAGVSGIAFVGNDLYLAQGAAVTQLTGATSCNGACVAQATQFQVVAPSALAADAAAGALYVVDTPVDLSVIRRFRLSTRTEDVLADGGSLNGAQTSMLFSSGVSVDPTGTVLVADDPSNGVNPGQGRLWSVTAPQAVSPPSTG